MWGSTSATHEECRREVHREHAVPLVERELGGRLPRVASSDHIDEYIDMAELWTVRATSAATAASSVTSATSTAAPGRC